MKVDIVKKMKEILKSEYGINDKEEFEAAVKNFAGINIGIFTEPFPERSTDSEYRKEIKVTA